MREGPHVRRLSPEPLGAPQGEQMKLARATPRRPGQRAGPIDPPGVTTRANPAALHALGIGHTLLT
jgi:hypothetical protein